MANLKPTDILRKEHEDVLALLSSVEEDLKTKNMNSLKENLLTLEKEFDKHSLNKEEKALFPEIEKFIPREGGPTGMMIIEHAEIVESIGHSKDGIETNDFKKVNQHVSRIADILRPHIDKENNMLFMMADMHLDDDQNKLILKKFEEIDRKFEKN